MESCSFSPIPACLSSDYVGNAEWILVCKGKVALITGANRGIGAAIAIQELAKEGVSCLPRCSRSGEAQHDIAAGIHGTTNVRTVVHCHRFARAGSGGGLDQDSGGCVPGRLDIFGEQRQVRPSARIFFLR